MSGTAFGPIPSYDGSQAWTIQYVCGYCESLNVVYSLIGFPLLTTEGRAVLGPASYCLDCQHIHFYEVAS